MSKYKVIKTFTYLEELTVEANSIDEAKMKALSSDAHENEDRYGDHLLSVDAALVEEPVVAWLKKEAREGRMDDKPVQDWINSSAKDK